MTVQARVAPGIPTGGQFAAHAHGEPQTRLVPAEAPSYITARELFAGVYAEQAGTAEMVTEYPSNGTETKRLLKNPRGANGGKIRKVSIQYGVIPKGDEVEIVGPRDGRPIVVELTSGMVKLKVASGKAIILSNSSWGNVVEVADGAEATVIAEYSAKVTMTVDAGGTATFHSTSANRPHRMYAFVADGGTCLVKLPGEEAKPFVSKFESFVPEPAPAEPADDSSDDDDDDKCSCGASLDDGEGWDGKCGNCADVAEVEGCTQSEGCDSPGHVDGCPEEW